MANRYTAGRSANRKKKRKNSSGNARATDQISMDAFQSGSLHTNFFSSVCDDLWFVARSGCGVAREKKPPSPQSFSKSSGPYMPSAKRTDRKESYRRSLDLQQMRKMQNRSCVCAYKIVASLKQRSSRRADSLAVSHVIIKSTHLLGVIVVVGRVMRLRTH